MNKSGRYAGARSDWKKAYVTLAEGQTIEAFDIA
jgi:ribosomal protein L23